MSDRWLLITGRQYDHMKARPFIVKLGGLPFSKDEYRDHVLRFFGERDGVVLCRYCRTPVDALNCAVDHAVPLKRGGSCGLENLEFPCERCNSRKGGLTPTEFLSYIKFRNTLHPAAQIDLDDRLEKAVQALTSMARFQRKRKTA